MSTNIGFRYSHTIGLLAQTGRGFRDSQKLN